MQNIASFWPCAPQALVIPRLARLLDCPHAGVVEQAVAALANLACSEELQPRIAAVQSVAPSLARLLTSRRAAPRDDAVLVWFAFCFHCWHPRSGTAAGSRGIGAQPVALSC